MSIHPMKTFPSFLSIHHSAISSQIKRRAVNFVSTFVTLTVNWPVPVSVYCSKASNLTYAISSHHILPTETSKTFAPALINTSHLLCCMPVVSGTIIWNMLTSKLICLSNFELSLSRTVDSMRKSNNELLQSQQASQTDLEKFRSFVNDASVFVRYFGMAMAKSAPHIYLSALPFAPTRSLVSANYSSSFPRILRVECGRLSHWPSSEMMIPNVGNEVNSVALSPDGQRIVSGSTDRTIRVWNATTGETEAGPFTGHTDPVEAVAFSPDGQRIVSGSHDKTICVWNATTGETEAGPFTGHTSSVESVAFSPDGQRIVS